MKSPALWPAGVALVVVVVLAGLDYPRSRAHRVTNVDLARGGFPDTYIMLSKTDSGRGYVVNRHESTLRRSDSSQPGDKWQVARIPNPGREDGPATWLIRSKRKGKGTVFFVPADDVQDWTYPFCYAFVRGRSKDLELPRVEWNQLFVNREYQGLFLRVTLPFDRRKKDGGSGILRQILEVRGSELTVVNTRFDDSRGLFTDAVAAGVFPQLEEPSEILAWLTRRNPTNGTFFLMSNVSPNSLTLLPLPIKLSDLFEAKNGRTPAAFTDDRYRRWTAGPWSREGAGRDRLTPEEAAEMKAGFEKYASSLREALLVHATVHQSLPEFRQRLAERQAATAELQLSLRGL